jgi:radical SAM protein with 4Fe4S-binding SPASM domain
VFVSHRGEIFPSGFLPIVCGNVRAERVLDVYRNHPVFAQLRDSEQLEGKCGACEYRNLCGGSRARAYALTGDFLQSDELCAYVPPGYVGSFEAEPRRLRVMHE